MCGDYGAKPMCAENRGEAAGRTLHREFVGMLFALAIAQVAIQAAKIVNTDLAWKTCLPAYSHLFLATVIITASWVGWGKSRDKLSNIEIVFSRHFVELLMDLWLVALYYFVVMGVEVPIKDAQGNESLTPSLANESLWLMVIFITYFVWDLWTKVCETDSQRRNDHGRFTVNDAGKLVIFERGWASLVCGVLGFFAWRSLPQATSDASTVLVADLALLCLVLLFRAMKLKNRSEIQCKTTHFRGVALLTVLFLLCLATAVQFTSWGAAVNSWIGGLLP